MNITITIPVNELSYKEYRFYFNNGVLYLDDYILAVKPTKRHRNYEYKEFYSRLGHRKSNMQESEVLLTDEIKKMAIDKFCSGITCKKWSERK